MRLRKIKNALEKLESDKTYYLNNPLDYKGKWKTIFNNDNPINIEIGCGKGQFIINMAKSFPLINFVAIEKFDSVLIRANELALTESIPNLRMILADAINLNQIFDSKEINNIYLNFSDPWPKTKHAKRRLTSPLFLNVYKEILNESGKIIQKTDNRGLFQYSIESFSNNGFYLSDISVDLHKDEVFNVTTEFEDKWSLKGPIYKLEANLVKKC